MIDLWKNRVIGLTDSGHKGRITGSEIVRYSAEFMEMMKNDE